MNFENIFVVISDFSQYVCQSVSLSHSGIEGRTCPIGVNQG